MKNVTFVLKKAYKDYKKSFKFKMPTFERVHSLATCCSNILLNEIVIKITNISFKLKMSTFERGIVKQHVAATCCSTKLLHMFTKCL